jgi:hypothetical protein
MTEREFLDQQMRQAKGAMSHTAKLLGKNLGHSVDPRRWTKSHPWLSLSAIAVAGFAAISLIPHHKKPPAPPVETKPVADEKEQKGGLLHSLLGHAAKLAWKWTAGMLVSNIANKMKQDNSEEPSEGEAATQPVENTAR